MVSVVLPSRRERYLKQTVESLLTNAGGDIEVIVVLDGYKEETLNDPRVKVVHFDESIGMRAAIIAGVGNSKGEFVMKLDAHCKVAKSFDEALAADYEAGSVVIPREYRLDAEKWDILNDGRLPLDYWYFIDPRKYNPRSLHGFRWDERTREREQVLIDNTLTFQGSCWFMSRAHFDRHKFLRDEGYQGLPQQEAEEIGLTTWLSGGRVMVNKKTWYAHWHKGKNGRGYPIYVAQADKCYEYSYNHWVIKNREGFTKLIDKFMPIPGWPEDWEERIYG